MATGKFPRVSPSISLMDYYEPTFLFRQNAIRRPTDPSSPYSSGHNSTESLPYSQHLSHLGSSWMLNNNNTTDTLIMNKACALDRVNIKSNYWRIPDVTMNLTALAASNLLADSPLLAISSASADQNLFIYELDALNHYMTHHTTITLPNIQGLAWVPNSGLRYLVTGNNKGYAHLVSVPLPKSYGGDHDDELAEIIKRFNHRKHLKLVNKDPSIHSHTNSCVSHLGFVNENRLVSVYDDTLFVWDMCHCDSSAKPRPELISIVPGISSFDARSTAGSIMALSGSFGVSLFDTRSHTHNVPNLKIANNTNRKKLSANLVKWHPSNENLLAAAHGDGIVRLWDIRKDEPFAQLTGHQNKTITALEWNQNDIFTGASDGNIVHWDLTTDLDTDLAASAQSVKVCSLKEGLGSVSFDTVKNSLVASLSERQCGTKLPALNNLIVGMCQVSGSDGDRLDRKVISIDGSAFLGLHSKIYDAVDPEHASEKMYYSSEDLSLLTKQENSNSTLVASSESLSIKPLQISRKPTLKVQGELSGSTETVHEVEDLDIHASCLKHKMETEMDTEDEFTFSSAVTELGRSRLPKINLDSYLSLPNFTSSPSCLEKLAMDSIYTLSTSATVLDVADSTHHKKLLFSFLDTELDKICMEFQDHLVHAPVEQPTW